MRADVTGVQQRLFDKIVQKLSGTFDYAGEVKAHFDQLLFLLIKFLTDRIDGESKRFGYLKRFSKKSDAPIESALQDDLHNYLLSVLAVDVEKTDISSGRADLYIPRLHFRLIIELKRTFHWTDENLSTFLTQAVAYSQTDIRLGVLGVLDLSDRSPGVPHIDQCFDVVERNVTGEPERTALIMRVPGNVKTPSNSK